MRKKLIAYEWLQDLLIAIACVGTLALMIWVIWFLYELVWAVRCAFGV